MNLFSLLPSQQSMPRWCHTRVWCLASVAVALLGTGCSADPPLSPRAYQYAEATLGVCTRRAADAVEPLLKKIAAAVAQQELTEFEAEQLREILESATSQEWEQATRAARALLNRQTRAS